jgi:mono/diheme cytochrome c family protein
MKNITLGILIGLIIGGLAIQFISYGHNHTNPPVAAEPQWNSQQTRDLAARACFDCHSNQTTWPWYSNIAPVSWLIQHDVQQGRAQLNFSQWGTAGRGADNAAEQIQRGTMPPSYYVLMHPTANLSAAEKQALIQGLNATTGGGG